MDLEQSILSSKSSHSDVVISSYIRVFCLFAIGTVLILPDFDGSGLSSIGALFAIVAFFAFLYASICVFLSTVSQYLLISFSSSQSSMSQSLEQVSLQLLPLEQV
eukprot:102212_1